VELVILGGAEYLFYKALPLDVAFLRGTTADPEGNITMEREALTMEALAVATAVHNADGLVIVQVERVAENGSLSSREVKIRESWSTASSFRSPSTTGRPSARRTPRR